MKALLDRGDEALVRALLKQALGELDCIASEPAPHEEPEELARQYRAMARRTAQRIRFTFRIQTQPE